MKILIFWDNCHEFIIKKWKSESRNHTDMPPKFYLIVPAMCLNCVHTVLCMVLSLLPQPLKICIIILIYKLVTSKFKIVRSSEVKVIILSNLIVIPTLIIMCKEKKNCCVVVVTLESAHHRGYSLQILSASLLQKIKKKKKKCLWHLSSVFFQGSRLFALWDFAREMAMFFPPPEEDWLGFDLVIGKIVIIFSFTNIFY